LLEWHERFTRFTPHSELSRLNADARFEVPVSDLLGRLVEVAREAAELTGGLVDATMVHELEAAGYRSDLRAALPLPLALRLSGRRRPAGPSGAARWRELEYDRCAGAPAHHLLDPATGQPAFTGVVQVTALAPSALEAEIRAKAAVLSGPGRAHEWLPDGGVIVGEDGGFEVVAATTAV